MARPPKLSKEEVIRVMDDGSHPVWTAEQVAEETGVKSPKTARNRLEDLVEDGEIEETKVGNAKGYYLRGLLTEGATGDQSVQESLRRHFEGCFVGREADPSTAMTVDDGPAEAGDRIQIEVGGEPGDWYRKLIRSYEGARDSLDRSEIMEGSVQALISGELYAKPTVPIEHVEYPSDYDLEGSIGGQYQEIEDRDNPILVAAGPSNYLVKPCNDAVFLRDVEVEWISPEGEGDRLETFEFPKEDRQTTVGKLEDMDPEQLSQ